MAKRKPKLHTHTLQIKVHAPRKMSARQVAGMVNTIIAVGLSEAEESSDLADEDQMNDPNDALALHIGEALVISTQKRQNGPQLSDDGIELSDGGVIEWPDGDGTIRRKDKGLYWDSGGPFMCTAVS